jgi:hypothetical protein
MLAANKSEVHVMEKEAIKFNIEELKNIFTKRDQMPIGI